MSHLTPEQVYDVAVLANKYCMVERFTLAKSFWLRRDRGFSAKAMWNLMMAAYLFKSDRDLFYYSNLLVTKKNSSLVRYASKTSCWITGLKLCCKSSPLLPTALPTHAK